MRMSVVLIYCLMLSFGFDMYPSYLLVPKGYKKHRTASSSNFLPYAKKSFAVKSNRRLMDSRSGQRYVKRKKNRKHSYQY